MSEKQKTDRSAVNGFTIVEALVAISIVAVLMALFLPALQRSRAVVRTQVCANNLRQILIGFDGYATENNDYFPSIGSQGIGPEGGATMTPAWWYTLGLAGYFGGHENPVKAVPTAKRWRVFYCPSETGSRFGLNGDFRDNDAGSSWNDEGQPYYLARRRGSSYDVNRSLMPGTGGYRFARKGYRRDFYKPTNITGYSTTKIYNRSEIRLVADNGEAGSNIGTNFNASMFDSTFDNTFTQFTTTGTAGKLRQIANLYAFRHPGGSFGIEWQGEQIDIGTANSLFLDGHVKSSKHRWESGELFYTPMFPLNTYN
jgi:prepilin-type processing-associated H-X9-DG protein